MLVIIVIVCIVSSVLFFTPSILYPRRTKTPWKRVRERRKTNGRGEEEREGGEGREKEREGKGEKESDTGPIRGGVAASKVGRGGGG